MLLRNDGENESGSCSEDEHYICSDDDGANDILLFYAESDYHNKNDKGDAIRNDGPFDNSTTYILKSCNGSQAWSLIRFPAAYRGASISNINTEEREPTMHAIRMSCIISDCFPFFFRTVFSQQHISRKVVKFRRPVKKYFNCRNAKLIGVLLLVGVYNSKMKILTSGGPIRSGDQYSIT